MTSSTQHVVPTPDFYTYGWSPPSSVAVRGRFLVIEWPDGRQLEAFDLWLLENSVGRGVDTATREGLIDPAELDPRTRITSAGVTGDGAVEVVFDDHPDPCLYHPGWLRHVADGLHGPERWLPQPKTWLAADMQRPPTHHGPDVLDSDEARRRWLNDLVRFGLARLRSLPADADILLRLAALVGPVRGTNFGTIWDVKADVALAGSADTNSTANTTVRLGPHTDLPTRETPPGFQFLHCFRNETSGGQSTMTDGAALVDTIRAEFPDHYDALTTLRWIFFNRGPGLDHRWSGPLIDLGGPGSPLTLRAFYPVRAFPDMAPRDMPRAYEAMRVFSDLAASERFQIDYPFEPGDMVAFDNRRILHGRGSFESGGLRHLRGIYIDQDDVYSATRVANRRADQSWHEEEEQENQVDRGT